MIVPDRILRIKPAGAPGMDANLRAAGDPPVDPRQKQIDGTRRYSGARQQLRIQPGVADRARETVVGRHVPGPRHIDEDECFDLRMITKQIADNCL